MVAEDGERWKILRGSGFSEISKSAGVKLDLSSSDPVMDDEGLECLVRGQEPDEIWTKRHVRREPT